MTDEGDVMTETPHTAENDAGIRQAAEPCWFPMDRAGYAFEWGEGIPHWQTIQDANEGMAAVCQYEGWARPAISLHRESEPCWHVTCDECGYRYDEDEWVSHFPDRTEAQRAAEDCDWHIADGRLLCPECIISYRDSSPTRSGRLGDRPPAEGDADV